MNFDFKAIPQKLFAPDFTPPGFLAARWLFLGARAYIFFRVLFACFPNSWADWPEWDSSRAGLSRPSGAPSGKRALLVRAYFILVVGK